jgi:hypothetical protein
MDVQEWAKKHTRLLRVVIGRFAVIGRKHTGLGPHAP